MPQHRSERASRIRVGSPIVFRPGISGPERVVRPCRGDHRDMWLSGYIVLSCKKCTDSITLLSDEAI